MRSFTEGAEPISVEVGEEFALRLPSTPTTGYRWSVAEPPPDEQVVRVVDDTYEAPSSDRPGAGGAQVLRLRAVGAGSTVVGLLRRRSWEGPSGAGPDAVFAVSVR